MSDLENWLTEKMVDEMVQKDLEHHHSPSSIESVNMIVVRVKFGFQS